MSFRSNHKRSYTYIGAGETRSPAAPEDIAVAEAAVAEDSIVIPLMDASMEEDIPLMAMSVVIAMVVVLPPMTIVVVMVIIISDDSLAARTARTFSRTRNTGRYMMA